jgi:hypothetical protein
MRLLDKPMERTTTKKIKRPVVEQMIRESNPGTIVMID